MAQETRRERFLRLAENRTNKVLVSVRVLSNCANRYNYEYTPEEVKRIFSAIENEVATARARFEKPAPTKFKLGTGETEAPREV